MVSLDDFDLADDVSVQFFQILTRNPPLCVFRSTDDVGFVLIRKLSTDFELRDVADSVLLHVPKVHSARIADVRHGVEDGLVIQPWWPSFEPTLLNKVPFGLVARAIHRDGWLFHGG